MIPEYSGPNFLKMTRHEGLYCGDLFLAHADTQLGAPEERVLRVSRPLVFDQVAKLGLVKPVTEILAEIGDALAIRQDVFGVRAVEAHKAGDDSLLIALAYPTLRKAHAPFRN